MQHKTQPSASTSAGMAEKHFFTVGDLAEILDVNHKTVRMEIAAGRIKHVRMGRLIRVPRAEVLRLLGE